MSERVEQDGAEGPEYPWRVAGRLINFRVNEEVLAELIQKWQEEDAAAEAGDQGEEVLR